MKQKIVFRVFCVLTVLLLLAGCSEKDSEKSDAGKDTVKLVLAQDIATMNPTRSASLMDSQVYCNIYDQLFRIDAEGTYIPLLAEKWDVSEDGKEYTFYIRKGVKFHNGDELKSGDVAFSFNAAASSPYLQGQFSELDRVEAIDDYTVKVYLKSAYAPFIGSLYDNLYILNEKAVTEAGDNYGESPVGTGPYKFLEHRTGVEVVLERFDDYWNGKAPIKNAVFKIIGDQNTALIALKTGEVDYVFDVPAISKPDIEKNEKLVLHETPTIRIAYILMNTSAEPFNNVKLRQAVNYAIDKDKAIIVATEGLAAKTAGVFSKDIFGYAEIDGYEYNPDKAKELLVDAGYADGLTVTFKTMSGAFEKVSQSVQEDLGKIGIKVNIEVCEKNAYIQALAKGDYAVGNISVSCGSDADYYGILFQTGSQANFSHYSNPELDELFNQGKTVADKEKRIEIYKQTAQMISDEAVIVPLYYPTNLSASSADLKVGYMDPIEITFVSDMSWK